MYRYVKRSSDLEEQAKEPAAVQALLVERRPVARVMSGGLESSLTNQHLPPHLIPKISSSCTYFNALLMFEFLIVPSTIKLK